MHFQILSYEFEFFFARHIFYFNQLHYEFELDPSVLFFSPPVKLYSITATAKA